jgi:hypothetical protein
LPLIFVAITLAYILDPHARLRSEVEVKRELGIVHILELTTVVSDPLQ